MKTTLRKAVTSVALVLGLMVGALAANAPVAAAAPAPTMVPAAGTTYYYPVYHYQVCNRQGHFGATYGWYWNPYSWRCYDLSFPFGFTIAGGLDINGWCAARYPGSYAGLTANNVFGWKCIKRM